ncbi:MAG: hypothetical protein ACREN6_17920 [Gemmatimonadaceae bacterium]
MPDLAYIAGIIAFFALMLLYARFCVTLSGKNVAEESRHDS